MSKNTNIAELINYISVDGSGNVVATTGIKKSGGTSSQFLKADGSVDASTYATQTYVTTAVSNLVASAPSTLDTLNELATALGNDANFATTVSTSIGNRVPYTGANADVVLGTNNLKSKNTFVEGDGSYNGGGLRIKQYVSQADGIDNYNTISSQSTGFAFSSSFGGGIFKNFILDASSLTNTTQRVYTLPDASGTLALTSNLSSYLPLAGGTLTGPLNGTSASFSGAASVINTFNLYKTGGTTLGGQLAYDSAVNQLYLWNNVSSGYFSIYTNSTERFKILSSGNIGVNTPTPLELFSVTGNIHIAGVGNSLLFDTDATGRSITQYVTNLYEFHILNARGNSSRFILGNGSISLGTSTTPQFFINTSSGNIGMGTTSPLKNLHVYASNGSGIGIGRNLTNDNFSANLFFYPSSTSADKRNWAITTYYSAPGLMEFRRSTTTTADPYDSGVTVMSLDSVTDFVGIGTASPTEPLSVSFSAHGLISQHRKSNGIGVGQNFYMKFNNAAGSAVSYAGIYSDIQDNTTGAHTGRMSLQVANAGSLLSAVTIASSGNVGIGSTSNSKLNVGGALQVNRSIYNWYQGSYTGNSTYLHIKTNLWCGGSPSGNSDYTMSLFKGYSYAYSSPPALEGTIVFHNWDGSFYNIATTGNLFVGAYKSADGYVVLVTNSGNGEAGVTIDWHQAYGYPFRDRTVSTTKLYGSTTGGY